MGRRPLLSFISTLAERCHTGKRRGICPEDLTGRKRQGARTIPRTPALHRSYLFLLLLLITLTNFSIITKPFELHKYITEKKKKEKDNSLIIRTHVHKQYFWGWRNECSYLIYFSAGVLSCKHWYLLRRGKEAVQLGFGMVPLAAVTSYHYHYCSLPFLIYCFISS